MLTLNPAVVTAVAETINTDYQHIDEATVRVIADTVDHDIELRTFLLLCEHYAVQAQPDTMTLNGAVYCIHCGDQVVSDKCICYS